MYELWLYLHAFPPLFVQPYSILLISSVFLINDKVFRIILLDLSHKHLAAFHSTSFINHWPLSSSWLLPFKTLTIHFILPSVSNETSHVSLQNRHETFLDLKIKNFNTINDGIYHRFYKIHFLEIASWIAIPIISWL